MMKIRSLKYEFWGSLLKLIVFALNGKVPVGDFRIRTSKFLLVHINMRNS